MTGQTLYVLYNADASVMGKLRYGYKKVTCPKDADPTCAACEITHGGLSLKETPAWVEAKKEIEDSSDVKIVQWHRDELSSSVKSYIEEQKLTREYPFVLLERDGKLQVAMDKAELARCNGDAKTFFNELKSKGVLSSSKL